METEPNEVNDFPTESKLDNPSSEQTQRDIYHQDGSFGIGHMSRGTIEKGAQVAGTIYNINLPQQIKNQNTPCNIKRTGSANFVGRTKKLKELHQLLQQNEQVTISAIAGMGGIGKTELALQYAIDYQDNYPGSLCWFSVRGKNLGTQIIEFAGSYLNLFVPDEYKSDLVKVEYCWRNWRSEKSLIVLDDVPDYGTFYQENIAPYLPSATNNIKVLMTSRERPGTNITRIDLDVLTEAVALELLEKLIGKSRIEAEPNLAKELCKWLGYLPLGLELVGRYIALDESLTIEKTLKRLEKQKLKARALLDPKQADMTAQLGVATAFDLSWDVLSPEAQELGCYLSLFASDSFKWSWVETAGIESEDEYEREEQIEDLAYLRNLQLINRNLLKVVTDSQSSTKYNYQLHSLIAQYFRAKLEERKNAAVFKQKFCAVMIEIAQSIPNTPTQKEIQAFAIAVSHM
ncbi:MAG: NB-ARC domain-containing protein, partial [Xenococcus sp. (in: cyanobacteria)]